MSLFKHLNEIDTTLMPITQGYWEEMHEWIYAEIGKKLTDNHVVDIGCGCGLLGIYLVYNEYVDTAELYDPREPQITYAEKLVEYLDLTHRITIHREIARPERLIDKTIVSTRFGDLEEFEKFIFKNKLITVRRTAEVEPLFVRKQNLPWKVTEISNGDFELELLECDFDYIKEMINRERWVESLSDFVLDFLDKPYVLDSMTEVSYIGGDKIKWK